MTSATATTKTYAKNAGTATVATRKVVKQAPTWYKFGEGAPTRILGLAAAGFVVLVVVYAALGSVM